MVVSKTPLPIRKSSNKVMLTQRVYKEVAITYVYTSIPRVNNLLTLEYTNWQLHCIDLIVADLICLTLN